MALPHGADKAFGVYYSFLESRGRNVNLTAISGAEDVARMHFLDSLALLAALDFKGAKVVDVGSGAGFPGVPIKLAEPSVGLTLLDATGKRVAFLSELCALLGIDAACLHARAEVAARGEDMRECFDIVLSRAVARLNVLCELCLPFVRVGGVMVAMKGQDSQDELDEASGAIETLGAVLQGCVDYTLPGTDARRRAVLIRKTSKTPEKFPRRYAKIKKEPM